MHKIKQNLSKKLKEDNWEFLNLCRINMGYIIKRYSIIELIILNYYVNKFEKRGLI